ncbi:lysine--tRNA ligase [Candidatus Poribacteria bacterium]|nr:MAG: lysine--tRNA ligase [Candidatus Poribacteria bacterium]
MEDSSALMDQHREKLEEIRQLGVDPYAYKYSPTHTTQEIREQFAEVGDQPDETKAVRVAGRIMTKRDHGKSGFAHLQDGSGRLQIYVRQNAVGEEAYQVYRKLDVGDIIGVGGPVFRTRTGELTVLVDDVELLAKSLRPPPEKWHGLQNKETRYRQRYADLMMNPDVMQVFINRTRMVQAVREYLNQDGFIEVETPILQPIYGGATARPFTTHHNALDMPLYLRIANELYLKRLIVGGFDRVYEFSRDFRNEGIDHDHSPEFTMIELYQAYADYEDMMDLTENLLAHTAKTVLGTTQITYKGDSISLDPPWRRLTMIESIKEETGTDVDELTDEALRNAVLDAGADLEGAAPRGKLIAELFEAHVEPNLVQPTFIYDYPIEISPFAKKKRGSDRFVERFEFFIARMEMGNAFSELNDPIDQRERFIEGAKKGEDGAEDALMIDEDYLRALEYGMPPTGGLGFGIDRLAMLLTDQTSIRDVILFPQMRPERTD